MCWSCGKLPSLCCSACCSASCLSWHWEDDELWTHWSRTFSFLISDVFVVFTCGPIGLCCCRETHHSHHVSWAAGWVYVCTVWHKDIKSVILFQSAAACAGCVGSAGGAAAWTATVAVGRWAVAAGDGAAVVGGGAGPPERTAGQAGNRADRWEAGGSPAGAGGTDWGGTGAASGPEAACWCPEGRPGEGGRDVRTCLISVMESLCAQFGGCVTRINRNMTLSVFVCHLCDGGQRGWDGGGELFGVVPPWLAPHGQDERWQLGSSPWWRAERWLTLSTQQRRVGGRAGVGPAHAAAVAGVTAGRRLQGGVAEGGVQRLTAEGGRQGGGRAEGRLQRGVAERRVQGGGAQRVGKGVVAERWLDVGVA